MRDAPPDVHALDWSGRDGFGRVRAEWFELIRWDAELLPADKVILSELGARFGYDRDYAWPSIPRLAADLAMSEPTVKRGLARSIQRGWLVCEKRGFGGSNHYAMAASRAVVNRVIEAHDCRVATFVETRRSPIRSRMIPMGEVGLNEITDDPSMRSPVISHSDHPRPVNQITRDPLSLSRNPVSEPDHISLCSGLVDATVQDKSQDAITTAQERQALIDARSDLLELLGEGDAELGTRRAALIGIHRAQHLTERIADIGVVGAADDIQAALAIAIGMEAKAVVPASSS